ncbi:hypothetical protein L1049_015429 [Liquidambar formosana]|uniref:Uncharacterized protein n=1 Tax=Liquidambar formosana TaxID=63359 RepID=A0AAP0X2I6_LIQFO
MGIERVAKNACPPHSSNQKGFEAVSPPLLLLPLLLVASMAAARGFAASSSMESTLHCRISSSSSSMASPSQIRISYKPSKVRRMVSERCASLNPKCEAVPDNFVREDKADSRASSVSSSRIA